MEIVKINRKDINDLDIPDKVTEVYLIKNELDIVGYGFINYDSNNEIEIYIKEDYRGENYGEKLFLELYNSYQKDVIRLNIELSNYPMIRIAEKYNGINIGCNGGIVSYIIKKS